MDFKISHSLKTLNPYFEKSWGGDKTFEVRVDDRDFNVGDYILLYEYDPISGSPLGRGVIVHVLSLFTLSELLALCGVYRERVSNVVIMSIEVVCRVSENELSLYMLSDKV